MTIRDQAVAAAARRQVAGELAAAQLEALNLRTERDVAQQEAAALRDLVADLMTVIRSTYHYLGDVQMAVQRIVGGGL